MFAPLSLNSASLTSMALVNRISSPCIKARGPAENIDDDEVRFATEKRSARRTALLAPPERLGWRHATDGAIVFPPGTRSRCPPRSGRGLIPLTYSDSPPRPADQKAVPQIVAAQDPESFSSLVLELNSMLSSELGDDMSSGQKNQVH